jgi:hypothetical protein
MQRRKIASKDLLPTAVTPNTYGSATRVPQVTVNQAGQLVSVVNVAIAGTAPGGAAAGDLGGTYPNPTVQGLKGEALPAESGLQLIQRNQANSGWVSLIPLLSSHLSAAGPTAITGAMVWRAPQACLIQSAEILPRAAWTIAGVDTIAVTLKKNNGVTVAQRTFTAADAPTAMAAASLTMSAVPADVLFAAGDILTLDVAMTGAALPNTSTYQFDYTPIGA